MLYSIFKFDNSLLNGVKSSLPLNFSRSNKNYMFAFISNHLIYYPTPISLTYVWSFGFLAGVCLLTQMISGIFLAMHYTPHVDLAFSSVEYIMRDVPNGWFLRYVHANGASMFFIVVYSHIFRGLYYGSYMRPRKLLWCSGVILFVLMMATAFTGYVLPWGQMSFWGAMVMKSMFTVILVAGKFLVGLFFILRLSFLLGLMFYVFFSATTFLRMAKKWSFKTSLAFHCQQMGVIFWALCYCLFSSSHEVTLCMPGGEQSLDFHPAISMDPYAKERLVPLVGRIDGNFTMHVDKRSGEECLLINDFDKFEQLCNSLYSKKAQNLYSPQQYQVHKVWVSCLEVWDTKPQEYLDRRPFSDFNKGTIQDIQAKNYPHVRSLRSIRLAVEHIANSGRSAIAVEGKGGERDVFSVVPRYRIH